MILEIGPRLEGHSVIFPAIQTHLSYRFLLAIDCLSLGRRVVDLFDRGAVVARRLGDIISGQWDGLGGGGAGSGP